VNKLNDTESEAPETPTWVHFAEECGYLSKEAAQELTQAYDHIIGKLVKMIADPAPWVLRKARR
jgi:four helix bundle protein